MKPRNRIAILFAILLIALSPTGRYGTYLGNITVDAAIKKLPEYEGKPTKVIRSNLPEFTKSEKKKKNAFENYSELDNLGRCGVAYANICKEIQPTGKRGSISSVHPSGWQSNMKWERCHLIGYQLAGENANEKNLITGTHYFNVTGMLPYENQVDDYVDQTGNHVLYRVTPYYKGSNLVADGVQMEAWSVEDKGKGVCFNVYVFNVQPGSQIDYKNGYVKTGGKKVNPYIENGKYKATLKASALQSANKSFKIGCKAPTKLKYTKKSGSGYLSVNNNGNVTVKKGTPAGTYIMKVKIKSASSSIYNSKTITKTITVVVENDKEETVEDEPEPPSANNNYICNQNTHVFHYPNCSSVSAMSEKNKLYFNGTRSEVINKGYRSCGRCRP